MSAVPKRRISAAEYRAIEQSTEFKSEFFNGEMFAMAGTSPDHNCIKDNITGELYERLKGGPCRTASSDQRVKVDRTGLYTYPDIVIVCGVPEYDPDDVNTLVNPRVIVEVLSPATERYDRTTKFRHYRQLPSVSEYILVSQNEPLIEQYVRQDDGSWKYFSYAGLDAIFSLATVPANNLQLADLFRGITFPENQQ